MMPKSLRRLQLIYRVDSNVRKGEPDYHREIRANIEYVTCGVWITFENNDSAIIRKPVRWCMKSIKCIHYTWTSSGDACILYWNRNRNRGLWDRPAGSWVPPSESNTTYYRDLDFIHHVLETAMRFSNNENSAAQRLNVHLAFYERDRLDLAVNMTTLLSFVYIGLWKTSIQ